MKVKNKNKDCFPSLRIRIVFLPYLRLVIYCMAGHVSYGSIQSLVNLELLPIIIFLKKSLLSGSCKIKIHRTFFSNN